MSRVIAIFVFIGLSASVLAQQGGEAVVLGSVVDSSQGVVAGAKVTLTHLATGATTELVTGDRGQYRRLRSASENTRSPSRRMASSVLLKRG